MMTKIFLTGATGYVGGEALYQLYGASSGPPEIAALVRDSEKASQVQKAYPEVRIVDADLDTVEIIEEEAKKADVVLNLAATGHLPSAKAILKGLTSSDRKKVGIVLRSAVVMAGASIFSVPDIENGTYGDAPSKTYNDLKDAKEIRSVIEQNPKRLVEQLVLAQEPSKVKTALIIGPLIYGEGRGPCRTDSVQVPEMASNTLQRGKGFQVGAGLSVWNNIYVQSLGSFFSHLLKAAVEAKQGCWNNDGVYAVEQGQLSFGELAKTIVKEAHSLGLIDSADAVETITAEEADKVMPHGSVLWATNAVCEAARARQQLDWRPSGPSLQETIADVVKHEAKRLRKINK